MSQTYEKFDICVVGSGPAGSVLAVELSRKYKYSVLLIDVGLDKSIHHPYFGLDKINCGKHTYGIGRAFQFGGSSNLWSGKVSPLDEIDFIPRDWLILQDGLFLIQE